MKTLSLFSAVLALTLGLSLAVTDAEAARRLGGGGSVGMQRQMTPPSRPAAAPASPTAPAQAAKPAPAPAAAAPSPARSWMGPLAGLAAGIGLAALASHFGFGQELANIMMIALLAMGVMLVIGFIMRRRAAQGPAMAGAGAGMARSPLQVPPLQDMPPPAASMPMSGAEPVPAVVPAAAAPIPADFDVPAFVRNAKVHFIRLQAANDARNLDDIREFTTPEMFAELKLAIDERGTAAQRTDVASINADVLEVVEESNRYVVSVRYTGTIRENDGPAESVDEIWHLTKPRNGSAGWLLAGIQQVV